MHLAAAPARDLGAAVEQNFQQSQHAGVVNLDAGDAAASELDRQRQALEQGELDRRVQRLGFEGGEAAAEAKPMRSNDLAARPTRSSLPGSKVPPGL